MPYLSNSIKNGHILSRKITKQLLDAFMKISVKLVLAFLFVAAIAATIGVIGINRIPVIKKADSFSFERVAVPLNQLGQLRESCQLRRVAIIYMLRSSSEADIKRYCAMAETQTASLATTSEA
jgi:methyl-accepting chemotaxis protein